MKRIGIVASKISKGNLLSYNLYVILISFLFSLFIFIIAGATVLLALTILTHIGKGVLTNDFAQNWSTVYKLCMITLTIIISIMTLIAIAVNIKINKLND